MFASQTAEYLDDDLIGTNATAADANFDTDHPLYRHIADLAELRRDHPALTTGAQLLHEPVGPVFAMSRFDRDERVEYLVLTNSNGSLSVPARVRALSSEMTFTPLVGATGTVTSDEQGEVLVEVPPLTTIVLRADEPLAPPEQPAAVSIVRPRPDIAIPTERYRLEATVSDGRYAEVTFSMSVDGAEPTVIGVDDAPPYRVYWSNGQLPANTPVSIIATVADGSGRLRSDVVDVTIGDR